MPRGVLPIDEARLQRRLWTPALAGTALWLDAADLSTISTTSGAVSEWRDKSGFDRHAVQGTAGSRPAFTTVGGYPVVQTDGTNDELIINSQFFPSGAATSASYIIAAVARVNTFKFGGVITTNPAGTNTGCGLLVDSVGKFLNNFSNSQSSSTTLGSALTIIVAVVDAGVRTIRINGTQEGSAAASSGTISQSTRVIIGKYRDEAVNFGALDLGEIVVIVGASSGPIQQKLEGYLAHSKRLIGSLPAAHPYRNRPPLIGA